LIAPIVVATAALALAPIASARLTAAVTVQTAGGTRIVVKLTSTKKLSPNQRPRRVSVKAGKATFKLTRQAGAHTAAVNVGTWRTAVLKGSAASKALSLRGKKVTVMIRLPHGALALKAKVASGGGSGGSPGSPPLFTPPGTELTGQAAFDNFKRYFFNSEFSDCQAGRWPACSVENRYEHGSDSSFQYHRCTPTSGSDVNFYEYFFVTGAAQHADGSWIVEYTDQGGAGLYHWEVNQDGTVNGYYQYMGGPPDYLTGYYWRQPAHLGDCYS
jgi:hypothetical protein